MTRPILQAQGLQKRFGAIVAASDMTVDIAEHTVVGLIGTNGAGKTTFINMITGYLKPDVGTIIYDGTDITPLRPRQITRLGVCRSFQIPQLYDTLTVRDNLVVGLGVVLRNSRKSWLAPTPRTVPGYDGNLWEAADTMLQRFGLSEHSDQLAGVLPEGVRKLLDIAMALLSQPKILLLDEPTSGVSAEEKFDIMDRVIEVVRAQNVTVLFVEHDMDIVKRYAERVLAFYAGRILADGKPDEVLTDPQVLLHVVGMPQNPSDQAATPAGAGQGA